MLCSELLKLISNYETWVSIGYEENGEFNRTPNMKVGNIPFKSLAKWDHNKHVLAISPYDIHGEKGFYIVLAENEKED